MFKGEKKDAVFNKEEKKIIFHNVMCVCLQCCARRDLGNL